MKKATSDEARVHEVLFAAKTISAAHQAAPTHKMDQNGSLEVSQPTQESFISIELSDSGSRGPLPSSSPLAPLESARTKEDQQEAPEEKTLLETMMEEPGFEFAPEIRL